MKTEYWIAAALFAGWTSAPADIITLDGANFGARVVQRVNNTDYTVGTTITSPAISLGSANLGDNSSGRDFLQVWAFDVTPAFAADIANLNGATLEFDTGDASGLSGDPTANGATTVYLLDYKDATGTQMTLGQATTALETAGSTALGMFDYVSASQPVSIPIPHLDLAGVAAGERLYFALDNGISANATGDFFKPGATAGGSDALSGITLTSIPEPSTLSLLGVVGAGLFLRRRFGRR